MEKLVFCKKYNKELPSLDRPPYPGPKGQEIYETVSKKAWQEWLNHQTMLINERQLNLTDKVSRQWLNEQMELFLLNGDFEKPSGFRPED
ncbi:MAG: oxidative damage protection protein [Candidatus Marinimicrobia bacterium]|nr:oxidative damage protection protein [Candidatus Neomarinimicrobiota bacterium]|tara:strand:+ start:3212 stop:3481 length:270 start_codon:yes stop_codon:yes gene_type:complete